MSKKLKIGLDCDDVLFWCTKYALDLEAAKGRETDYEGCTDWSDFGPNTKEVFEHFKDPEFYRTQPVINGAKKFVKALLDRGHEVIIITAIAPEFAGIRGKRIREEFPDIPERNIMLGARKDLLAVDVLLDDAAHNLTSSPARYPICFRRPWNEHLTGLLSVFDYDEALSFIDKIAESYVAKEETNKVYCLVGPSGSGKTSIAEALAKDVMWAIPKSTTTRARRPGEAEDAYNFVTLDEFAKMKEEGKFIETTIYSGNRYGTTRDEIDSILDSGRNAVMPIDINGANALKMKYGSRCTTVYIKRSKKELINVLLSRLVKTGESLKDETLNRILSIESERKNAELCDRILVNNKPIAELITQF